MRLKTWIATCIRAINNALCYIQYPTFITINIVHKVSEGMQGVKSSSSEPIIWAHKAWVKMMQLDTSAISAFLWWLIIVISTWRQLVTYY